MTSSEKAQNEIFISYSRRNETFVSHLVTQLRDVGIDPWFDRDDIPKGAEWWQEIQKGIIAANAFAFVISPHSVQSMVCQWELAYAIENSKKIIPILHEWPKDDPEFETNIAHLEWGNPDGEMINAQENWALLQKINFVMIPGIDNIEAGVQEVIDVARTDLDHLNTHTRLLERAREWDSRGRKNSFLLTGDEIAEAEAWLQHATTEPIPSILHQEYIQKSRKQRQATRRNFGIATIVVTLIIILLGVVLITTSNISQRQSFARRALTELDGLFPERSTLIALEGIETFGTSPDLESALYQSIYRSPARFAFPGDFFGTIDFSPDGEKILSTYYERFQIHDADTGEQIASVAANDDLDRVIYSADGTQIVTAGDQIQFWDAGSYQQRGSIDRNARSISLNRAGDRLLSVGSEIELWDTNTLEQVRVFDTSAATGDLHPDGSQIAIATNTGTIELWNVTSATRIARWDAHSDTINSIRYNDDGTQLISASRDQTATIWDVASQDAIDVIEPDLFELSWAEFGYEDRLIVTAGNAGVKVWDTATMEERYYLRGHRFANAFNEDSMPVDHATISPDGQQVATVGSDNPAFSDTSLNRVYDITISPSPQTIIATLPGDITYSPDGQLIAAATGDNSVRVWDAGTYRQLYRLPVPNFTFEHIAFTPDNTRLVVTSDLETQNDDLMVFDLETGDIAYTHDIYGDNLTLSPDGSKVLLTRWLASSVVLFELDSGELIFRQGEYTEAANYHPSGDYIIAYSFSDAAILDANTGDNLRVINGMSEGAIHPDGNRIASINSSQDRIQIFDFETGAVIQEIPFKSGFVDTCLTYSADGERLIGHIDSEIVIFDASTGEQLALLYGHEDAVQCVDIHPDGTKIISSGDDTIRIWDVWSSTDTLIDHARDCCVVRRLEANELQLIGLVSPVSIYSLASNLTVWQFILLLVVNYLLFVIFVGWALRVAPKARTETRWRFLILRFFMLILITALLTIPTLSLVSLTDPTNDFSLITLFTISLLPLLLPGMIYSHIVWDRTRRLFWVRQPLMSLLIGILGGALGGAVVGWLTDEYYRLLSDIAGGGIFYDTWVNTLATNDVNADMIRMLVMMTIFAITGIVVVGLLMFLGSILYMLVVRPIGVRIARTIS